MYQGVRSLLLHLRVRIANETHTCTYAVHIYLRIQHGVSALWCRDKNIKMYGDVYRVSRTGKSCHKADTADLLVPHPKHPIECPAKQIQISNLWGSMSKLHADTIWLSCRAINPSQLLKLNEL